MARRMYSSRSIRIRWKEPVYRRGAYTERKGGKGGKAGKEGEKEREKKAYLCDHLTTLYKEQLK